MWTALQLIFAGLGVISIFYVLGVVVILALLALAYLSPIDKLHFVFAAVLVAAMMVTYSIGLKDGGKRCDAQGKVINSAVDKAVDKASKATTSGDRYDNKDN